MIPLFVFMGLGAWIALRDVAPDSLSMQHSFIPDPPSLHTLREALRPVDHRLMVRWIVVGAFTTLGLMIALLGLAVLLGHRLGVDFSLADESDVRSTGPLILLGAAVLLAFPIAGFLVAKASSAHSVLEPALAAGLALGRAGRHAVRDGAHRRAVRAGGRAAGFRARLRRRLDWPRALVTRQRVCARNRA